MLKVVEHQEKATYGLGYKLTLTRYKDDAVIDKAAGIDDSNIKLITSFRTYLITHHLFQNKVYCLNNK